VVTDFLWRESLGEIKWNIITKKNKRTITAYLEITCYLDVVRRVKQSGIIKERSWEERYGISGAGKYFFILMKINEMINKSSVKLSYFV
jgi:hypothetical protein